MLTSLFKALEAGPRADQLQRALLRAPDQGGGGAGEPAADHRDDQALRGPEVLQHDRPCLGRLLDPGNRRALERLPEDVRAIVEREFDRSAADQRADIAKLSGSLREDLTAKGLQFIDVDRSAFRQALRKTSFYADWKAKYGEEAGATSRRSPASWCEPP